MSNKEKVGRKTAQPSTIGTVERETGLSKDTLRIWERRYGFPRPARDSNGERVYPDDQVQRLRVIRRLIDRGLRPGKIVREPLHVLSTRIGKLPTQDGADVAVAGPLNDVLQLLKAHKVAEMRQRLEQSLMRLGVERFVLEVVAPLTVLVGDAWTQGRIEIFEEHLYTEQIQHLLRQAIGPMPETGQTPRVLLTTLRGEEHQIGLLMAHACLAVEGAQCISLGVQTPAAGIVQAARAHRADIVGLSFSPAVQLRVACAGLADLREQLDRSVAIWAGGAVWQRVRKTIPGVTFISSLTAVPSALADWRAGHSQPASG